MQTFPRVLPKSIAVTYVCDQGHIHIRHWRLPCPVDRSIACSICKGKQATISATERQRHARLLTGLDGYLVN
jgi:hypothetical protein